MHLSDLPRFRNRIDWKRIFATHPPGSAFSITMPAGGDIQNLRKQISKSATYSGARARTAISGSTITITILPPDMPAIHDAIAAAKSKAQIREEIIEARTNITYWTRQRDLRTDPAGRLQASIRITLWQSTLQAKQLQHAKA